MEETECIKPDCQATLLLFSAQASSLLMIHMAFVLKRHVFVTFSNEKRWTYFT